jgi:hypothetical protein
MIKRNFTFLLSVLLLLNLIFRVDVNIATRDYVPRNIDMVIPKIFWLDLLLEGEVHLKLMLGITAVLSESGYNVRIFF